jgi:hypothetical protein
MGLAELEAELTKANAAYHLARTRAEGARASETEALNLCNRAQKALDDAVAGLRKTGPSASDWGRQRMEDAERNLRVGRASNRPGPALGVAEA